MLVIAQSGTRHSHAECLQSGDVTDTFRWQQVRISAGLQSSLTSVRDYRHASQTKATTASFHMCAYSTITCNFLLVRRKVFSAAETAL